MPMKSNNTGLSLCFPCCLEVGPSFEPSKCSNNFRRSCRQKRSASFHRETTEIWLLVQGQIGTMLALDEPYCGLCSDIKRAFNHIGRQQVFHMGHHLGYPIGLMNAWQKFLNTFQRCFEIRG